MPQSSQNKQSLEWREEYSIGVTELDAQHKTLFALLQKLNAADSGFASEIARSSRLMTQLEELNEYAVYHLLSEEKIMREHLPPDEDSARHIAAHRSYWQIMSEFKLRHQQGDPNVGHELLDYLNRWWLNHILQTDKKMGAQLNVLGIR